MKKIIQIDTDAAFVEFLKKSTGQKAASKAFLYAAQSHSSNVDRIAHLEQQNADLKAENARLYDVINSIEHTYREIQEVLGQGSLDLS